MIAALVYVMGLALAEFPHTLLPDGRALPIQFDALSQLTIQPGNSLLPGSVGTDQWQQLPNTVVRATLLP